MSVNRTILLVDDDNEMLLGLKESLNGHAESIPILFARDGIEALQILKHQPISLVVTELQMPRMNGFELLAAVTGNFPDIPVVIITDFSTPDMEQLARHGGAAGFIVRPFSIELLADRILFLLQKEIEGGFLHGISAVTFLQLVEMEQKTCTVRLEDRTTGKRGALFFVEGALCDARQGDLNGKSAAFEILGWDPVSLWIQNSSVVREDRIQKDVHLLMLEAARRRDENQVSPATSWPAAGPSGQERPPDWLDRLQSQIEKELGNRSGMQGLFRDSRWAERIRRISRYARKLNFGRLVTGYIDQGEPHAYVMVGGETPAVIVVSRKCPRDKILRILAG